MSENFLRNPQQHPEATKLGGFDTGITVHPFIVHPGPAGTERGAYHPTLANQPLRELPQDGIEPSSPRFVPEELRSLYRHVEQPDDARAFIEYELAALARGAIGVPGLSDTELSRRRELALHADLLNRAQSVHARRTARQQVLERTTCAYCGTVDSQSLQTPEGVKCGPCQLLVTLVRDLFAISDNGATRFQRILDVLGLADRGDSGRPRAESAAPRPDSEEAGTGRPAARVGVFGRRGRYSD